MPVSIVSSAAETVRHGVERCVACGLCLPHCPTYRLTQDEAESPRGRIALIRALTYQTLPPDATTLSHLEHCLGCRACEKACPSHVPYGQLIDAAWESIETRPPAVGLRRRWRTMLLNRFIANRVGLRRAGNALYWYQRSGLQRLLRASGLLSLIGISRLEDLLPKLSPTTPAMDIHAASGERKGAVALFMGCVASVLDYRTQEAAIRLLNTLGYDVYVPPSQGCCGALHLRAGETETAHALMRRNLEAFAENSVPIVTTASGCGAFLREYGVHAADPVAGDFAGRITDISQFLAQADWRHVRLRPLPRRVAVHDSCTLTNVLCQEQAPYALLNKIPGVDVVALPENRYCCGGAGTYALTQPDMAQRLRDEKIRCLREAAPDILVTSNIGCALQFGAGIRKAGMPVEVLHPVALIERQLRGARDEIRGDNP